MKLCGACILTDNAPRLAAFYQAIFQESPVVEGSHYGFDNAQLAVYDPGNVTVPQAKGMSLMYFVPDVLASYERLRTIPGIRIASPPTRRPWGAFSFWILDPDGNTISFIEKASKDG